jgi:hypothetical protein
MRHRRSRERRTELEGHGICGAAGHGEIEGERRDGMPKGFRLRKPLLREVDSLPIELIVQVRILSLRGPKTEFAGDGVAPNEPKTSSIWLG